DVQNPNGEFGRLDVQLIHLALWRGTDSLRKKLENAPYHKEKFVQWDAFVSTINPKNPDSKEYKEIVFEADGKFFSLISDLMTGTDVEENLPKMMETFQPGPLRAEDIGAKIPSPI